MCVLLAACQWNCRKSDDGKGAETAAVKVSEETVVKASPAARQEWIAAVPISGNLKSLSIVEVKPEVGGRLIAVHFREGDLVRKNQLLAEIDPVNYRLAVEQAAAALTVAQAGVERAEVAAEHARTEKERADNLLRSGGITQKDHQAALTGVRETESQVRLAKAQVNQAQAALAIAQKTLKDCRIVAPSSGHIEKKRLDQGSLTSAGVSLCTLVDNSQLELECVVPAYQLASIQTGQRAEFTTPTWGERRFGGLVTAINPTVESDSRSVKLNLRISNPGGELRNGMYARGEITTGREANALVISRDSLIPEKQGAEKAGVYVVQNGKAHRLDILVGGTSQDRVWVRQGLNDGDFVIEEIGPSIKEGAAVRTR